MRYHGNGCPTLRGFRRVGIPDAWVTDVGSSSVTFKVPASVLWSAALEEGHTWQRRFYDFLIWSDRKRIEKQRYMHRNPVKRGLVLEPEQWA